MDSITTNTPASTVSTEATQPVQQAQPDKSARFKEKAENQASKVMAEIEKLQNSQTRNTTPIQQNKSMNCLEQFRAHLMKPKQHSQQPMQKRRSCLPFLHKQQTNTVVSK